MQQSVTARRRPAEGRVDAHRHVRVRGVARELEREAEHERLSAHTHERGALLRRALALHGASDELREPLGARCELRGDEARGVRSLHGRYEWHGARAWRLVPHGGPPTDPHGANDERPQIPVTLSSFWIDRAEVTSAEYAECIRAGICTRANTGGFCNMQANDYPIAGRERHPINCVSWFQASTYCSWRGRRLPTEQEWEYEARGGSEGTRLFPWGDEAPSMARACISDVEAGDRASTCEGGSHPAGNSAHGLVDLAGNVWEWTSSVYSERGHGIIGDAELRTEKGASWTAWGKGWGTPAEEGELHHLRAAFRSNDPRGYQSRTVGFRCARDF